MTSRIITKTQARDMAHQLERLGGIRDILTDILAVLAIALLTFATLTL